jgi:hypothetical protein
MERHSNTFTVVPDKCFHLTSDPVGDRAAPTRCTQAVEWVGRIKFGDGVWHGVGSCRDHVGEVDRPMRIEHG